MVRLGLASTFAVLILTSGPALAQESQQETDPTIQYLITTPTTLMDKGVWEVQSILEELNSSPYLLSLKPEELSDMGILNDVYVWPDSIKVSLHTMFVSGAVREVKDLRATCHAVIRFAQEALRFQPQEGGPQYMAESLEKIFSHYGYVPVGHPSNLGNRLLGLFTMEATIFGDHYCHTVGSGPIQTGKLPNR